jgi:hypothetical protein
MVEMKVDGFTVPEAIGFNYQELKKYVGEIVAQYAGTVVTEDTIPAAKADLAKLRKADNAINDRRIELEKKYKEPFDRFKAQVDDIRGDLKKAEDAIDHQLKDFDAKAAEEKTERIKALYFERDFPAWVPLQTLWNPRWLNKTYQLEDIAAELTERKQKIDSDMQMLSTVPEFGNLAAECYKDTLDPAKAIELARGILEKQKKVAEKEQQLQPLEKEPLKMEEAAETSREWVSFRCLLSESEAKSLNTFFRMNHIRFEAIDE